MNINSDYLKNITVVSSGTVIAQIIPILLYPVLSRLYTPADFGIYAFAISIGMCVASLAASQYNHAVIIENDEKCVKNIVNLATVVSFCIVLLFTIILCVTKFYFQFPFFEKLTGAWFLLPLYALFMGLNSTLLRWNNRNKFYSIISKGRIIASVFTIIIQIGITIIFNASPTFLLLGMVLGQFFSFLYMFYSSSNLWNGIVKVSSLFYIKNLAIKYKNFLLFTSLSDFLNIFINQLPIVMLTKLVGVSQTGQFAFSNKLLALPISFISASVGEVFRQRAVEDCKKKGNCNNVFIKTFKGLFLLSIIPFTILFIFAPDIFALVFGEIWREAGVFSRIMTPMFFFKFTVSPLTYIFYIHNRQKEDFILHLLMLFLTVTSLYLGYFLLKDVNIMLLLYSMSFVSIYLYYFARSYFLSRKLLVYNNIN